MSKHQFTDIRVAIEPDNPSIQRLEFKCIKCGNCKTVCTDYIGVCGTYDLKATGDKPICINCGQCANVCPADSRRPAQRARSHSLRRCSYKYCSSWPCRRGN